MSINNSIPKWVLVFKDICNGKEPTCPCCGEHCIAHRFVAGNDRIGYAELTCKDCKQSVTLSRVMYPEHIEVEPLW